LRRRVCFEMKFLALAASLRRGSWNRKLRDCAVNALRVRGADVDVAEFAEFDVPLYNADLQDASGIPTGAAEFGRRIGAADGLVLVSPEYNYSLPGTLKNLIDWASRIRPVPLRGKHAVLLAASTGAFGGIRGLWQLRIPLEGLGLIVFPDMFALPAAPRAFTAAGELADPATAERLGTLIERYLDMAERLAAGTADR
jgi:chromate reductase